MRSIFLVLFSCILFSACSSDNDKTVTSIEPEFTKIEITPGAEFVPFRIQHHPSSAPIPQYGFECDDRQLIIIPDETNKILFKLGAFDNAREGTYIVTIVTDEWIEAKIEVVVKKKAN